MGQVLQQGTVNLASLVVDDVYVIVAPPPSNSIQGINTGIVGLVGGASWGPVNVPIPMYTPKDEAVKLGPLNANGPKDLPTDVVMTFQQGVSQIVGVRVTDGTDAKATIALQTAASGTVTITGTAKAGDIPTVTVAGNAVTYTVTANDVSSSSPLNSIATNLCAALNANATFAASFIATVNGAVVTIISAGVSNTTTFTVTVAGTSPTTTATASGTGTLAGGGTAIGTFNAIYTGTEGNNLTATLVPGASSTGAARTWTLRLARSGVAPLSEVFTNLPEATLHTAIANALTNGQSVQRGPSVLASFTSTAAGIPQQTVLAFTGGTNGDQSITSSQQMGTNAAIPSTGMYALEGQGVLQFGLCGNTDSTTWTTQIGWAKTFGAMVMLCFPAGTTSQNAVNLKKSAGVDDYYAAMVKDWIQFMDTYNGTLRLVSPLPFAIGRMASLSPEQSPENKPINGIVATERTLANSAYSSGETALLESNGIMFITNQCPGGSFWGLRHGLNSSSNNAVNGIEYTRMTLFLAYSLSNAFGSFIGRLQTQSANDPTRAEAKDKLTNFFSTLKNPTNRIIDDFSVDMSYGSGKTNDPVMVAQGFMQAIVRVKYLSVVRYFTVTLIGGRTVDVSVSS